MYMYVYAKTHKMKIDQKESWYLCQNIAILEKL